jgi:hypothetical protein
MAVKLVTNIHRFQCLSSDVKPLDPPEGSTLHIVDTGEEYIFFDGMWIYDLRLSNAINLV